MKNTNKIFYGKSVHGSAEIKAVVKVLKNSTQMAHNVKSFESKISKVFSKKYGLMVNSGSSAIHVLMDMLNFKKGSEVIVPALNFATPISSLVKFGLVPNFVDINPHTLCIDEKKIIDSINKKTVAMIIPNLIGSLPNWKLLRDIANKYNLSLIEDSADTLGAYYNKKYTGYYSDYSITSFYGSHIINCAGNGGMLCLNDLNEFNKLKVLRSWGRDSSIFKDSEKVENRFNVKLGKYDYDAKFLFSKLGYNFEPSELGAAFGLEQFKKLKININLRNKYQDIYDIFFSKYPKYFSTIKANKDVKTCYLAYPVVLNDKYLNRKKLQIFLEKNNIQTRVIFTGNILLHPGFKKINHKVNKFGLDYSNNVAKNGMLLPCHHGLKNSDVSRIISLITKYIKNNV